MNLGDKHWVGMGGSPGLVVMRRDSQYKGSGFESRHRILDGHFFTYICCKNCNDVCLKRRKINEKEAGVGPYFFKKTLSKPAFELQVNKGTLSHVFSHCVRSYIYLGNHYEL